ncbi:MAG TPA: hypothetical protein VGY54_09600 [Polyangiaceae bacterium]|nr:hypothetical protein [Polyangiaceae bacterium]
MKTVRFLARPRADLGEVIEIVPAIDDAELTDLVHAFEQRAGMETRSTSYGGLIPSYFNFGSIDDHFLGVAWRESNRKSPLLGCSCGEWGCWPLLARIVVAKDSVTWSEFEQPHRKGTDYSAFGPFSFVRTQYERALVELQLMLGG